MGRNSSKFVEKPMANRVLAVKTPKKIRLRRSFAKETRYIYLDFDQIAAEGREIFCGAKNFTFLQK